MNTKQVQCLLNYLGYSTGGVDGIRGEKTEEAVELFQKEYGNLTADGTADAATQTALRTAVAACWKRPAAEEGTFWTDIKHFRREEFRCKCGGKYCNGFPAEPEEKLIRAAEAIRDYYGRPVHVSSGVRCRAHNETVGGVSNSRHLKGKAMDFMVSGLRAEMVLEQVKKLEGVRYAYAIGLRYVHMDIE